MSKIKEIPSFLRPREKALRYGIKSLSDKELLALIIGSGTKENSALDLADALLKEGGLKRVGEYDFEDFQKFKGISSVRALTLEAIFEISRRYQKELLKSGDKDVTISYLVEKYQKYFLSEQNEHLIVISLSKKGSILKESDLVSGLTDEVDLSAKDVLKEVIKRGASFFILIHNHPSGDVTPSDSDINFTYLIINQCARLDLKMLDHIIVGKDNYYSFKTSDPQMFTKRLVSNL